MLTASMFVLTGFHAIGRISRGHRAGGCFNRLGDAGRQLHPDDRLTHVCRHRPLRAHGDSLFHFSRRDHEPLRHYRPPDQSSWISSSAELTGRPGPGQYLRQHIVRRYHRRGGGRCGGTGFDFHTGHGKAGVHAKVFGHDHRRQFHYRAHHTTQHHRGHLWIGHRNFHRNPFCSLCDTRRNGGVWA